jgi:cystathionine gamma-synthase
MDLSTSKKGTAAVWAGEKDLNTKGAATSPIVNSVAFSYHDLDEWHNVADRQGRWFYL